MAIEHRVGEWAGRHDLGASVPRPIDHAVEQAKPTALPPLGLLGKALDKPVMGKVLNGNLALELAALGEHLSTGDEIAKGWKPAA